MTVLMLTKHAYNINVTNQNQSAIQYDGNKEEKNNVCHKQQQRCIESKVQWTRWEKEERGTYQSSSW